MKNATGGSDVAHVIDGDHATAARAVPRSQEVLQSGK